VDAMNVSMSRSRAGFAVTMNGRFLVSTEGKCAGEAKMEMEWDIAWHVVRFNGWLMTDAERRPRRTP
jgi:hypothetical protein